MLNLSKDDFELPFKNKLIMSSAPACPGSAFFASVALGEAGLIAGATVVDALGALVALGVTPAD